MDGNQNERDAPPMIGGQIKTENPINQQSQVPVNHQNAIAPRPIAPLQAQPQLPPQPTIQSQQPSQQQLQLQQQQAAFSQQFPQLQQQSQMDPAMMQQFMAMQQQHYQAYLQQMAQMQHQQQQQQQLGPKQYPVQCYCAVGFSLPHQNPIQCVMCKRWYHPHCIPTMVEFGIILGDDHYQYQCQRCTAPDFDLALYLQPEELRQFGMEVPAQNLLLLATQSQQLPQKVDADVNSNDAGSSFKDAEIVDDDPAQQYIQEIGESSTIDQHAKSKVTEEPIQEEVKVDDKAKAEQPKQLKSYPEILKRLHVLWSDINHVVLYHLTHSHNIKYFQWKQHLCSFVDQNWHRFFLKPKQTSLQLQQQQKSSSKEQLSGKETAGKYGEPWHSSIASALSSNSPARFICSKHQDTNTQLQGSVPVQGGQVGWWALTDPMRHPSEAEQKRTGRLEGLVYKGRIFTVPAQFASSKKEKPIARSNSIAFAAAGGTSALSLDMKVAPSVLVNHVEMDVKLPPLIVAKPAKEPKPAKESKRKQPSIAVDDDTKGSVAPKPKAKKVAKKKVDPDRPVIQMYLDIKNAADGPVRMSRSPLLTATQINVSEDGMVISNEKGYRMSKATHGVSSGTWYFECKVLDSVNSKKARMRLGFSQVSGDLQAPCGYDTFSYSLRTSPVTLFHNSNPVHVYDDKDSIEVGDTVGVMIFLPPAIDPESDESDPLPGEWDGVSRYDTMPYQLPRPICRRSWIRFFVNGQDYGVAFDDLYAGKYYPAVSSYMTGAARLNFGAEPVSVSSETLQQYDCKLFTQLELADPIHSNGAADSAAKQI